MIILYAILIGVGSIVGVPLGILTTLFIFSKNLTTGKLKISSQKDFDNYLIELDNLEELEKSKYVVLDVEKL